MTFVLGRPTVWIAVNFPVCAVFLRHSKRSHLEEKAVLDRRASWSALDPTAERTVSRIPDSYDIRDATHMTSGALEACSSALRYQ